MGSRIYYTYIGNIMISDGVTLTVVSDLNGASSQFTLTCISTGGPATTVTWTRDSQTAVGTKNTIFNSATAATTAEYTHTLTVTERLGGLYTCTVANTASSNSSDFIIRGIYTIHYYTRRTRSHITMCSSVMIYLSCYSRSPTTH